MKLLSEKILHRKKCLDSGHFPLKMEFMNEIKVNKIDGDVVWEMMFKAWELARVNYALVVGLIALEFLLIFPSSLVPYLGSLLNSVIGFLFLLMFFKGFSGWEKGESLKFANLTEVYKNKERMAAIYPLLGVYIFTNIISAGLISLGSLGTGLSFLFLTPVSIVLTMSLPILFFNYQKIDFKDEIRLAVQGLLKNVGAFFIGLFLVVAMFVLSTVFLVLPVFLIAIPVFMGYQYLWYRCVYEGLTFAEATDKEFI